MDQSRTAWIENGKRIVLDDNERLWGCTLADKKRKGVLRISEGQGEVRMRDIGSVPHNINTEKCLQIVNRSAGQPRTADSCLN